MNCKIVNGTWVVPYNRVSVTKRSFFEDDSDRVHTARSVDSVDLYEPGKMVMISVAVEDKRLPRAPKKDLDVLKWANQGHSSVNACAATIGLIISDIVKDDMSLHYYHLAARYVKIMYVKPDTSLVYTTQVKIININPEIKFSARWVKAMQGSLRMSLL